MSASWISGSPSPRRQPSPVQEHRSSHDAALRRRSGQASLDGAGDHSRHVSVHGAGADRGAGGRRAHGYFRVRLRTLRDRHGQEGVRREDAGQRDGGDPRARAAADLHAAATHAAGPRPPDQEMPREDPDARWQSAADLEDELRSIAESGGTVGVNVAIPALPARRARLERCCSRPQEWSSWRCRVLRSCFFVTSSRPDSRESG